MITNIVINNFKSFGSANIKLDMFNVIVGPNNSGKTNFKQALLLLRMLNEGRDITEAITASCASLRNVLFQSSEKSESFSLNLNCTIENTSYLYFLEINKDSLKKYSLKKEVLSIIKEKVTEELLYNDKGLVRYNDNGTIRNKIVTLPTNTISLHNFKVPELHKHFILINKLLKSLWFFDINPLAIKSNILSSKTQGIIFHPTGMNLSGTLAFLKKFQPKAFQNIINLLKKIIPEIETIDIHEDKKGKYKQNVVLIYEHKRKIPFLIENVSDGVLIVLNILTVLNHTEPPSLIFFEEIDKGIHFRRIRDVLSIIQNKTKTTNIPTSQIIITTHNPLLVDLIRPDNLIVAERNESGSKFLRLKDNLEKYKLINRFILEGTTLGELWYRGSLGGIPNN